MVALVHQWEDPLGGHTVTIFPVCVVVNFCVFVGDDAVHGKVRDGVEGGIEQLAISGHGADDTATSCRRQ